MMARALTQRPKRTTAILSCGCSTRLCPKRTQAFICGAARKCRFGTPRKERSFRWAQTKVLADFGTTAPERLGKIRLYWRTNLLANGIRCGLLWLVRVSAFC